MPLLTALAELGAWGALIALALIAAGVYVRVRRSGNGSQKEPMYVRLDRDDHDLLRRIENQMEHHNRTSDSINEKLDAVLKNQAREEGRHNPAGDS